MAAATAGSAQNGTEIKVGQKRSIITAAEANNLKAAPGKVGTVIIANVGTAATLDVYDDPDSNDNKVFEWVSADGKGPFAIQCPMAFGIRVVTGGTFGRAVIVWS